MKKVSIIMGSISDLDRVRPAMDYLAQLGVEYTVNVFSAHRTPDEVRDFVRAAESNGYGVIIAAAGKAAHLAGAVAAGTVLPVIGIPIKSSNMEGLDALLSTVQMPAGIPVATVAIDGSHNAAVLAVQILAVGEPELAARLAAEREAMRKKVLEADEELQRTLGR